MSDKWFGEDGDLTNIGDVIDSSVLADADAVIVMETDVLRAALKPLLRQKTGSVDDPFVLSVLLVPRTASVVFKTSNLVTYVSTEVAVDTEASRLPTQAVALDLASLADALRPMGPNTTLVISDGYKRVDLMLAGTIHIPCYSVEPALFDAESAAGAIVNEQASSCIALQETVQSLRRLAAAAEQVDMKMLFGYDDHVFSCDGTTVMKSDCFFVPTAVKLSDIDIVNALLSSADHYEDARLVEYENHVAISTSAGKVTFPKRTATLAPTYRGAIRIVESFFHVHAKKVHSVLQVLGSVRDSGERVTFVCEGETEAPVFTLYSKSKEGALSRLVVSREFEGTPQQGQIRMSIDAALRTLSGFGGTVSVGIEDKQLIVNDSTVCATVITSLTGTDR